MTYYGANFFICVTQEVYEETGELSMETLASFAKNEIHTGRFSYTDGIMMNAYRYTCETAPDPVVGEGFYMLSILQYFDGEGKIVFPPEWADQPFTPPGS